VPGIGMERFTKHAMGVLGRAQEEAVQMQHQMIDTEHILLGLMTDESSVAGRVLLDMGLERQRVEELVLELVPAGPQRTPRHLELSSRVKRLLELSVDEARRMGHHYIGTEHLLLGLVRLPKGVAIEVLKQSGVSPEEIRKHTRAVLLETTPEDKAIPQPRELVTLAAHEGPVHLLAFAPGSALLATASGDTVKLWRLPDGQEIAMLSSTGGTVHALAFSQDGKVLAVASDDGRVKLWSLL
jgi:ATP-dependent Clp protease ATP-binding subunit ClpA